MQSNHAEKSGSRWKAGVSSAALITPLTLLSVYQIIKPAHLDTPEKRTMADSGSSPLFQTYENSYCQASTGIAEGLVALSGLPAGSLENFAYSCIPVTYLLHHQSNDPCCENPSADQRKQRIKDLEKDIKEAEQIVSEMVTKSLLCSSTTLLQTQIKRCIFRPCAPLNRSPCAFLSPKLFTATTPRHGSSVLLP